jgi:hypothetical protein
MAACHITDKWFVYFYVLICIYMYLYVFICTHYIPEPASVHWMGSCSFLVGHFYK